MKPLQEWTVQELKSTAYDELLKLETCRTNIQLLRDEIKRREQVSGDIPSSGGNGHEAAAHPVAS